MPTSDWCTCHVASAGALPGFRKVTTRARRYCALAMAPNRSGVATTASARKWPTRAPAVNRTTPASRATSTAIERLGSKKISATSGASTMRKGKMPCWKVRMRSPFFAASIAVHTTTANFASSDGWAVTKPKSTQRRAPLMFGAMRCVNGKRGMSSSTVATASTGHAARRQAR